MTCEDFFGEGAVEQDRVERVLSQDGPTDRRTGRRVRDGSDGWSGGKPPGESNGLLLGLLCYYSVMSSKHGSNLENRRRSVDRVHTCCTWLNSRTTRPIRPTPGWSGKLSMSLRRSCPCLGPRRLSRPRKRLVNEGPFFLFCQFATSKHGSNRRKP